MPEGDTVAHVAERLAPRLEGAVVERLHGSHPALHMDRKRIHGTRVAAVRSVGKHLLISFDNGWALRTHLGMTGVWHVYAPGERWRKSPGKARVVLETQDTVAVCFAAPTVELGPIDRIALSIEHLGPDLMAPVVPWDDIVARASAADAETAADLLLDQRVMAGIGNVYKSETLYLEGVSPNAPAVDLDPATVLRLGRRARKLLLANRRYGQRSTTGTRGAARNYWVYGRAGQPCRRCRTPVAANRHGPLDRISYWCPSCQEDPAP